MIHNRNVCNQVDMTDDDLNIFLGLALMCEPRKGDRKDAEIMLNRTKQDAKPAEIQRLVFN